MRICFDLSPAVHRHAGIGRYAHELLAALIALDSTNTYSAIYNSSRSGMRPNAPLDRLPLYRIPLGAKPWRLSVMLAHLAHVPLDRWLPKCDLFHATDYVLPPLQRATAVLTIYDLTFRFFPDQHQSLNRWYLSLMLPHWVRRANAIIAISESARRDILQWLSIPPEKVRVIPLGVNPAYRPNLNANALMSVQQRYRLPPRFILYLGTIEPRKNLLMLLEAYRTLLARDVSTPALVIAGKTGWKFQSIFQRVHDLGLESRVHFTGWVDEADSPALMNAAITFVYPSLYEGFGLPPIEAMACGTPVVCSNTSSLPEVVGDAALLVNPHSAGEIADAISRVITDDTLRYLLRAKGITQAAKFSWQHTAQEMLAVYHAAVKDQYAYRH